MTDQVQQLERIPERPTLMTALSRGLIGRCPNCGQGRLFGSFLKQVDRCACCGEAFGDIEMADAAPWFTMLVVCFAAIPMLFLVQDLMEKYFLYTLIGLSVVLAVLLLVALPRIKGVLISAFWYAHPGEQT